MSFTTIAQIFDHYPSYFLLVCSTCPKVLSPRELITHIKNHYSKHEIEENGYIEMLQNLELKSMAKSYELIRANEPIPPISALEILQGYFCPWAECLELFLSSARIQRHISLEHGQSYGQTYDELDQMTCQLQQLTSNRFLFRVADPLLPSSRPRSSSSSSTSSTSGQLPTTTTTSQWAQSILSTYNSRVEALGGQPMEMHYSKAEWSTFNSTTRIADWWQARDLDLVQGLLGNQLPEQRSALSLCLHFLLARAEARVPFLARKSRAKLRTFNIGDPTIKEFRVLQQPASREKYVMVLVKFMQFLLASFKYQEEAPVGLENLYILTPSQILILQQIQASLDQLLDLGPSPQPLDVDSDDYDSEDLGPDLESSNPWEWDESSELPLLEPTTSSGPTSGPTSGSTRRYQNEAQALEAFLESFNFLDYSKKLILELSGHILDFLVSTMEKDAIGQFEHELLAFNATISMDFGTKSFKAPGVIAQAYSAFIYYFQLVVVEASSNTTTATTRHGQIDYFMETHFHNQANSGLASILAWRALALGINIKSSGAYNDVVPLPGEKIAFQNITISKQQLGLFFQALVGRATTILAEDLLIQPTWWEEVRHAISLPQASPFENILNREAYWHFLVPNPVAQQLQSFLYKKILQDSELGPKWFSHAGGVRPGRRLKYYKQLYDFQVILMLLVYGTSGGPPRGSEVPPILLANTPQATRTLFIDRRHHLLALRLRYSKTANRNYIEQQAIRLLPESVSFLVLIYMAIILPFINFLEILENGRHSRSRELLFFNKDHLIGERVLGRQLKSKSHEMIGQRVNIRSFCHIMQGFIRYYMAWNSEDPWASQNGEFIAFSKS